MSVHSIGMNHYTDEQLVRMYVDTQRNTFFEALYERYADKVYRKCLSFVKDQAKAEDFTHDIFLKLIVRIGTFKESSKFSTWLFSITYNYCMDQLRLTKKMAEDELTETIDVAEDGDDIEEIEMDAKRLRQALDGISHEERTILLMKYQDDFSIKDIADTFGLTESAVKMRLKRTKEKLKKRYLEGAMFTMLIITKLTILVKWWLKH
ncbi:MULTISPECIES: RNA polymerase sigma factor [Runella]|uniref:RNA polymerase sigma-70 factor (ECF subfamily) n=1 Tax=Runella defluvii TaxID=370973 RepID=A0A7W6EQG6_9BACT|nr:MULTISPECIES: sigma-70 family RNA polymerase sigma factor [Runella]MBB3838635.1 RNA polymerase sigma-70 factor (ECF subfamily) [Runella defluvii]MCA0229112.1 sigma-70 family RNA polymerase sigma factor [Bacteroidota bacterium]